MERLGLLTSVIDWVEARNLRNRLVHDYQQDTDDLAGALIRSRELVPLLVETYNRINSYSKQRMAAADSPWPPVLPGLQG